MTSILLVSIVFNIYFILYFILLIYIYIYLTSILLVSTSKYKQDKVYLNSFTDKLNACQWINFCLFTYIDVVIDKQMLVSEVILFIIFFVYFLYWQAKCLSEIKIIELILDYLLILTRKMFVSETFFVYLLKFTSKMLVSELIFVYLLVVTSKMLVRSNYFFFACIDK